MHASNAELLRAVDLAALGTRLRAARVARGWTQTDLAGDDIRCEARAELAKQLDLGARMTDRGVDGGAFQF